eukprot:TRINITY_DN19544_c0_g1_i1.p1 TRINITY_DN19544_c0_g1~~TRINITY_DN19544_c0_g1_i1.p1  ORF type:complete len:1176 (+),score=325.76 TRINITY_DN19544_c0_g1_i1:88-3615(+)
MASAFPFYECLPREETPSRTLQLATSPEVVDSRAPRYDSVDTEEGHSWAMADGSAPIAAFANADHRSGTTEAVTLEVVEDWLMNAAVSDAVLIVEHLLTKRSDLREALQPAFKQLHQELQERMRQKVGMLKGSSWALAKLKSKYTANRLAKEDQARKCEETHLLADATSGGEDAAHAYTTPEAASPNLTKEACEAAKHLLLTAQKEELNTRIINKRLSFTVPKRNRQPLLSEEQLAAIREGSGWSEKEDKAVEEVEAYDDLLECREPSKQLSDIDEEPMAKFIPPPAPFDRDPVVQFSTAVYYCTESDEVMKMEVIRLGDCSKASRVKWHTVDASALAGVHFEQCDGELLFAPGVTTMEVEVPLLETVEWNTTLEFVVELCEQGVEGAILGTYLWQARVKVIDKDVFPTSRFQEEIERDALEEVPRWNLLLEYFKLNWGNSEVRRRTLLILLNKQVPNIEYILRLYMNVYLVDYILNTDIPVDHLVLVKSRELSLVAVCCIIFALLGFTHVFDFIQRSCFEVGGTSRHLLQTALVRKYLHYDDDSRMRLRQGDLVMAMVRDTVYLVDGYRNFLRVLQNLGHLAMIPLFQVTAPVIFGRPFKPVSLLPNLVFPAFMITFLLARQAVTTICLDNRNRAQDDFVNKINQTASCYRLIADYSRRPFFVWQIEEACRKFNEDNKLVKLLLINNKYFAKWVAHIVVCFYTFIGGWLVVHGQLSLGMFLTNISIFGQVGMHWEDIYRLLMEIQAVLPALQTLTILMNLPGDVEPLMDLGKARILATQQHRRSLSEPLSKKPKVDEINIAVEGVKFKYNSFHGSTPVNHAGRMDVPQGSLVCIIGPHGEGKSTLLKIIGGGILPGEGSNLFIPSHLRVLHVSTPPLFFHGTLLENLTFGVLPGSKDGRRSRAIAICRRLGLMRDGYEDIRDFLEQDIEAQDWNGVLSSTEAQLLNIARALVANHEILCVHKPTSGLDSSTAQKVMQVLRRYVTRKGVEQDDAAYDLRRPRTCLMSTSSHHGKDLEYADKVFFVSRMAGVQEVEKDAMISACQPLSASRSDSKTPRSDATTPLSPERGGSKTPVSAIPLATPGALAIKAEGSVSLSPTPSPTRIAPIDSPSANGTARGGATSASTTSSSPTAAAAAAAAAKAEGMTKSPSAKTPSPRPAASKAADASAPRPKKT